MMIEQFYQQLISLQLQMTTNKLRLAFQQKHKQSNSKSNLKTKSTNLHQLKQTNKNDIEVIFTSSKVTELMQNFSKQISQPIQIYTELYRSKAPQKCLLHNNISTLYCLRDEKLLCAGCMYQTPIHKGHRVIPITQANEHMKNGIKNNYGTIEEHMKVCKKAIQRTSINLQRAERQYPELMQQVHNFFMGLHQLLIDKKNEHLQLLNQTWSKLRYQNHLMKSQLTRICDYIVNKLKYVSENQSEDDVTVNKNITEHLSRITDIVDDELVVIEKNNYDRQISKFSAVTDFANQKLVLFEIKSKEIHSLYLTEYKLKRSNSKTSVKKNKYSSIIKSPIKQKAKIDESLQKSAEQKLIEMMQLEQQRKSERSSPKNRYSMSQIKLLKDMKQRKKAFEKDHKKKKPLTPTKSQKSINNVTTTSFKASPKKQKSVKFTKK